MGRSRAFDTFRDALEMPRELMRQERILVTEPVAPAQYGLARGLRGGAAVLMVAAFEAFLNDMISEMVQYAIDYSPPILFDSLPDDMKTHNVFESLNSAMNGPRYQASGNRIDRLPAIKIASRQVANNALNPDAFSGTSGNPGKKVVKALFKRIGISNIFYLTNPRFQKKWKRFVAANFTADKLEEIIHRRHQVAHRADVLSISRKDLRDGERFLRVFGEVLDIEAMKHMRYLCKNAR